MTGATAYDMHVDQADGTTRDFTFNAPAMTPTQFYGTGLWRWQVRADFPGSNATSAYFAAVQYVRTIPAPAGVVATKSGNRIVISWTPDPDAKQYNVQLASTPGFGSPIASDTTENSVWVPQIHSGIIWFLASGDGCRTVPSGANMMSRFPGVLPLTGVPVTS